MKNSRLWEIFEQLSSKELREIEKCVLSPQFNNRESVVKLFRFLTECRNELKIIPTKEDIHRSIFREKEFEDIRIRNTMSFLIKVIERWFAIQEMEANKIDSQLALASVYRKKQLPKHYKQTVSASEDSLKKQSLRNADYYTNQYRLEFEKYTSLSSRRQLKVINLQALSDNLDISYLAQKLRQTCFSISHTRVYSKEYDLGLLPHLLDIVSEKRYQEVPAIALYYHGYFALMRLDEAYHFQKFKDLLFKFRDQFPKSELRDLYLLATNYCIGRINKKATQYTAEAFALYREGLKDDVLLSGNILPHITFSNIVTMSIGTGNYDFGEKFIEQYKNALADEYREPIYIFNLARLRYQRGNFDEALPLLQREVYRDLLLNLSAKTLTAKIFYESKEFDVLLSHLDAMQQFIRRKKVMAYHRENFQNFISLLRKIVELPPGLNKKEKTGLKKEIENVGAVVERKWLLERI